MVAITQLHSSAVPSAELNRILNEYIALEHARVFRRLLVQRFGLLSLGVLVTGIALHWISLVTTLGTVVALVFPPAWAWVVEIRRDRAFARRLARMPGVLYPQPSTNSQHARVEPTQKVIKSS